MPERPRLPFGPGTPPGPGSPVCPLPPGRPEMPGIPGSPLDPGRPGMPRSPRKYHSTGIHDSSKNFVINTGYVSCRKGINNIEYNIRDNMLQTRMFSNITSINLYYDISCVLGVHLSSDLSLDKHVSSVRATCFHRLRQLRRIRRSLDADSVTTDDTRACVRHVARRLLQRSPRRGSQDNHRQATTSVECCRPSRQ